MSEFIGRGENLVQSILENPWGITGVIPQQNISKMIPSSAFDLLDKEIQNHNFDFVCIRKDMPWLVIEVNYKHKEKAAKKWREIFTPLLIEHGYLPVTIDDYDCESLFKEHSTVNYRDIKDICNQFKKAGVKIG